MDGLEVLVNLITPYHGEYLFTILCLLWIITILAISVYFYYLVKTPLNKYLKKDILELIHN